MYGNTCRTLSIKVLFEKKWVSSQKKTKKKNNGDQRRAIYMYSRLLTGHPAQMDQKYQ